MELFFDTETTGMSKNHLAAAHESQPHVVQIAAILSTQDRIYASINLLVRPDKPIPKEASAIHGIIQEDIDKCAVSTNSAVLLFDKLVRKANVVVAHNLSYDALVMENAYHRAGLKYPVLPMTFCTMLASTNLCRIPGHRSGEYKWPKLIEAHQYFFNEGFKGEHNAMADVQACRRIYYRIMEQKGKRHAG